MGKIRSLALIFHAQTQTVLHVRVDGTLASMYLPCGQRCFLKHKVLLLSLFLQLDKGMLRCCQEESVSVPLSCVPFAFYPRRMASMLYSFTWQYTVSPKPWLCFNTLRYLCMEEKVASKHYLKCHKTLWYTEEATQTRFLHTQYILQSSNLCNNNLSRHS